MYMNKNNKTNVTMKPPFQCLLFLCMCASRGKTEGNGILSYAEIKRVNVCAFGTLIYIFITYINKLISIPPPPPNYVFDKKVLILYHFIHLNTGNNFQ